jgi:putative photosynthetic complex assembly protein 2
MVQLIAPLLFAVALWWASTGAILWLVRRPERSFGPSLLGLGALALAALLALAWSARTQDAAGAYVGFAAALVLWGWLEASFLTGRMTGPRRGLCPPGLSGWARFRAAAETLIHHEAALVAAAAAVLAISWGGSNPIGAMTFLLLLGLRLSTKLNLFLGVANPPDAILPERLAYLGSYFRRRTLNPLLPLSLVLCAGLSTLFAQAALAPAATSAETAGFGLLLGLAALGLIEHLFLLAPSPERALWGWALAERPARAPVLALAGGNPEQSTTGGRP